MGLVAFKRRAEAAKFEGETFDGLDLRSMKAFGSLWKNCTFNDCKMDLSNIRSSRFENCVFVMCSMMLADLSLGFFEGVSFQDCNLEQASFMGSHFTNVEFSGCRMAYAETLFENATVKRRMEFTGCNLHGSNLDFREVEGGALSFMDTNCWGAKISMGCAIWNARVDERMQKQLLALVARLRPHASIDALAGDQKDVVDRLMRDQK